MSEHLQNEDLHSDDNILEEILFEKELISESKNKNAEHISLIIRNILVAFATVIVVLSFFFHNVSALFRGIGYFLGATAYLCELLMLTDGFSHKPRHRELFMIYCFAPLYLLLGIAYILEHVGL